MGDAEASQLRDEDHPPPPPADDRGPPVVPRLRLVADDTYQDWEAIYRDNVVWVHRLMYSKVGNRPDAEDLTTEVFLAALKPLRVSATVPEVRAYLLATSRTVLAAHWRRTFGREITDLDTETAEDVATEAPSNDQARLRAHRIMAALPDPYRRILQLRFLDGRTIKDAAAEMGVSLANAKVLQHRALRRAADTKER